MNMAGARMQFNKEKIKANQLQDILKIDIKDKNQIFYMFKTSGTTGEPKIVYHNCDNYHDSFNKFMNHYNINEKNKILLTTRYDEFGAYSFGAHHTLDEGLLVKNNDIKEKIKLIKEAEVIFTTPSFMMTFRKNIVLEKHQRVFIAGESIPDILKNFLNQFDIEINEMFGTSESVFVASKKMNEEYFKTMSDSIKIIDNKIYSPHNCLYIKEGDIVKEITDGVLINDNLDYTINSFKFISRNTEMAKINEELISLREISNHLLNFEAIEDLVIYKTKENELDVLSLIYKSNSLSKEDIKKIIIEKFDKFIYLPKYIYKIDNFPLTLTGKKDMKAIEEWKNLKKLNKT